MSVKAIAVPAAANLIVMPAPASFQKRSRRRRTAEVISIRPETWQEDYLYRVKALFKARGKMIEFHFERLKYSLESEAVKHARKVGLEMDLKILGAEEMLFSELIDVVGRPE